VTEDVKLSSLLNIVNTICEFRIVDCKRHKNGKHVYVLKEEKEECHLRKYDEIWLWNKRLGSLNFNHLIKLRKSGAVKDLPKISKPYDYVCKPCQIGKLTRTQFKSNNFPSIEKPLQLVHMDLCGPSRN
jgi:hypothetical protein